MIVVLGLGKSGKAAAMLLLQQGKSVLGLDVRFPREDKEIAFLKKRGMRYASDDSLLDWERVRGVVVSPGIDSKHPLYLQARTRTCFVTSEVALALRYLHHPMVAITGTNGKTTVTYLVEHVFNACGLRAHALGNSGDPLCAYVLQQREEILVIELSSFQLELLSGSYFDAAALLNITPDHLDRYPSMEAYARVKWRIERCMKPGAPLFVNANIQGSFSQNVRYFSSSDENLEAAWLLSHHFGIERAAFERAFSSFVQPPHRIAFVKEIDGVKYFDDSKGTNVAAVIKAVHAMPGPVILLAGGLDKGLSFRSWIDAFVGKVKYIIAFGNAKEKILRELIGQFEMEQVDTLSSAIKRARICAQPGDCVLLSPGCTSKDQFRDYVHRGVVFRRMVQGEIL